MVARTVLDTLRQVSENATDVGTVFEIVSRLAQDVGKWYFIYLFTVWKGTLVEYLHCIIVFNRTVSYNMINSQFTIPRYYRE